LGLTPVRAFLRKHRKVALDTSVFIYYMEANPLYVEMASEIFSWLETPGNVAVTSSITMTELLVQPYRTGNEMLVHRYFGLLSTFPNLEWVAPDLDVAATAAKLRALHRLRTPDALQAATAICKGATGLITNDPAIARVTEISVGVLDDLR
jgi:predicted nucleic acid-binding protein